MGPSVRHGRNMRDLEKLEGGIVTEAIQMRKENNVYWVDTVINGKHAKQMIFDTGASSIALPLILHDEAIHNFYVFFFFFACTRQFPIHAHNLRTQALQLLIEQAPPR